MIRLGQSRLVDLPLPVVEEVVSLSLELVAGES
jgi:hypothetical protein